MKAIVERKKLVRIIRRKFPYLSEEQINDDIDEYGAAYFNDRGSELNIKYLGFRQWEVNI